MRPHCQLSVQEPRREAGPRTKVAASGWRGRRWVWGQSKREVHEAPEQQTVMPFKSHLLHVQEGQGGLRKQVAEDQDTRDGSEGLSKFHWLHTHPGRHGRHHSLLWGQGQTPLP